MDRELEVIRDDMEQTRANLADKLGALENQVRETVSGASEAVTSTVEGVKEVVSNVTDTVGSVTETFNISRHVQEHPWIAVGVAAGVGFVAAQLFGGGSRETAHRSTTALPPPSSGEAPQSHAPRATYTPGHAAYAPQPARHEESPSLLSQAASAVGSVLPDMPNVGGVAGTAVSTLSGLAVGSLMNVVRGLAMDAVPKEWKDEVNKLLDQVTSELGGKRVEPPKKEEPRPQEQQHAAGQGGSTPGGQNRPSDSPTEPAGRGRRSPATV